MDSVVCNCLILEFILHKFCDYLWARNKINQEQGLGNLSPIHNQNFANCFLIGYVNSSPCGTY